MSQTTADGGIQQAGPAEEWALAKLSEDIDPLDVPELISLLVSDPAPRGAHILPDSFAWSSGGFIHGGVAGVRTNVRMYPNVSRYLTKLVRAVLPQFRFSTVTLFRDLMTTRRCAQRTGGPQRCHCCLILWWRRPLGRWGLRFRCQGGPWSASCGSSHAIPRYCAMQILGVRCSCPSLYGALGGIQNRARRVHC
jgi:hypothetical protein